MPYLNKRDRQKWNEANKDKNALYCARYWAKRLGFKTIGAYFFGKELRNGAAVLNKTKRHKDKENQINKRKQLITSKTKTCGVCGQVKLKREYSKRRDSIDGYRNQCKACRNTKTINSRRASTIRRRQTEPYHKYRIDQGFRAMVEDKFGGVCFNCGSSDDLAIDHHYPLSLGFGMYEGNAVLLCKVCNSAKHNKLPEDFYTTKQLNELHRRYGVGYGNKNKSSDGLQLPVFV